MRKLRTYIKNHPKLRKAILFFNAMLIGGALFPFGNSIFPFSLWIIAIFIVSVGFITIYGENKEKSVYIASFILTGFGMIFRYFLEHGEMSNARNFTIFNIVSYLVVMPIVTVISYYLIIKYGMEKE